MALDRAQRDWQLACDETLRRLLDGHPLAGGAAELAEHATAMVVESERADAQVSADAQHAGVDMARFVDAVGRSWLPVKSQRACWAVKAQKDSVVMLSRDCAATDGDDEESVEAMIRVAALLALKRPKLFVRDWLTELCIDLVARRGLKWAVEGLTRKVSRLNHGR